MSAPKVTIESTEGNPAAIVINVDSDQVLTAPADLDGNWNSITIAKENGKTVVWIENSGATEVGSFYGVPIYYVTPNGYSAGETTVVSPGPGPPGLGEPFTGSIGDVTLIGGPGYTGGGGGGGENSPAPEVIKLEPELPVFIVQPVTRPTPEGTPAILKVNVSSGTVEWWRKKEDSAPELIGSGSTFFIPEVSNEDQLYTYYAIATTSFGSVTSDEVSLIVGPAPIDKFYHLVEVQSKFTSLYGNTTTPDFDKPLTGLGNIYVNSSTTVGDIKQLTVDTDSGAFPPLYVQYAPVENLASYSYSHVYGPTLWVQDQRPIGTNDFCFEAFVQGGEIPETPAPDKFCDTVVPLLATAWFGDEGFPENYNWLPRIRGGCCYTDTTGLLKWGYEKKKYPTNPNPTSNQVGLAYYPDNMTNPRTANSEGIGLNEVAVSTTNIRDGEWHYICVDRRDNITRVFVDGVLEGEGYDPWDYAGLYTGGSVPNDPNPTPPVPIIPPYLTNVYAIGSTYGFYSESTDTRWGTPGDTQHLNDNYPTWMGAISQLRLTVGVSRYLTSYIPDISGFSSENNTPSYKITMPKAPTALGSPAAAMTLSPSTAQILVNSPVGQPSLFARLPITAKLSLRSSIGAPAVSVQLPEDAQFFLTTPPPVGTPQILNSLQHAVILRGQSPLGAPALRLRLTGAARLSAPAPVGAPALKASFPSPVSANAAARSPLGAPAVKTQLVGAIVVRLLTNSPVGQPAIRAKTTALEIEVTNTFSFSESINANYAQKLTEILQVADDPFTFLQSALSIADKIDIVDDTKIALVIKLLEAANISAPLSVREIARLAEILAANDIVSSVFHGVIDVWAAIVATDKTRDAYAYRLLSNITAQDTQELKIEYLALLADEVLVAENIQNVLTIVVEETAALQAQDSLVITSKLLAELLDTVELHTLIKLPSEIAQGVAVNIDAGMPISEYSNFTFNSLTSFKGSVYGASDTGLYVLEGDTDEGEGISASLSSLMLDFGTSRLKRIRSAYLGYTSDSQLVLKVRSVSDGQLHEHWYKACPVTADAPREGQIYVGQGLRSRYWQFELTNVDGGDFEIDQLELYPLVLTRRV